MHETSDSAAEQAKRLRRAILERHGYAGDEAMPTGASSSIDDATRLGTISAHWGIVSDVPVFGKFVVVVKRTIRIALRWYINPIVDQQNAFNDTVVRSLHELQSENDRLRRLLSEGNQSEDRK